MIQGTSARLIAPLFLVLAVGCGDKTEGGASASAGGSAAKTSTTSSSTSTAGGSTTGSAAPASTPAGGGSASAAAGGGGKCKQAAEAKAKLKDPKVDPSTLGSVEFDKQDCESGKLSAGWADCVLGAKDYEAAKACK